MSKFTIETMCFTNPTTHQIKLDAIGLDPVGPGEDCEIPLTLCAPTIRANGTRGKSPLEEVAPQLVPKDKIDHENWMKVPEPLPPQSKIVTIAGRMPSEAPGVKALRDAAAAKATKAPVSSQTNVSTPATK